MKWVVAAITVISVAAATRTAVRSRRNTKAPRSTWNRATSAATSAAFAAANGVKGVVAHH
jgi:hypothetical protein